MVAQPKGGRLLSSDPAHAKSLRVAVAVQSHGGERLTYAFPRQRSAQPCGCCSSFFVLSSCVPSRQWPLCTLAVIAYNFQSEIKKKKASSFLILVLICLIYLFPLKQHPLVSLCICVFTKICTNHKFSNALVLICIWGGG